MGYDNNFHLTVLRCKNEEEGQKIIQGIEKKSGYTFESKSADSADLHEAHWYDAVYDIQSVAHRHPDAVIQLLREGEDKNDTELTRFRGEERETLQQQVTWPPFKNIVLPDENTASGLKMLPGRMYVILQIDYENDEGADDGETRQDILTQSKFSVIPGSGKTYKITNTQVLGESD